MITYITLHYITWHYISHYILHFFLFYSFWEPLEPLLGSPMTPLVEKFLWAAAYKTPYFDTSTGFEPKLAEASQTSVMPLQSAPGLRRLRAEATALIVVY